MVAVKDKAPSGTFVRVGQETVVFLGARMNLTQIGASLQETVQPGGLDLGLGSEEQPSSSPKSLLPPPFRKTLTNTRGPGRTRVLG